MLLPCHVVVNCGRPQPAERSGAPSCARCVPRRRTPQLANSCIIQTAMLFRAHYHVHFSCHQTPWSFLSCRVFRKWKPRLSTLAAQTRTYKRCLIIYGIILSFYYYILFSRFLYPLLFFADSSSGWSEINNSQLRDTKCWNEFLYSS